MEAVTLEVKVGAPKDVKRNGGRQVLLRGMGPRHELGCLGLELFAVVSNEEHRENYTGSFTDHCLPLPNRKGEMT